MLRGLNLGCGDHLLAGDSRIIWVNLDRKPRDGVQVAHDLEIAPLPFADNSFDLVLAFHVLEHITNYHQLIREIHRVMKPGATLAVRVPHHHCGAAVADPTHVRFFVPASFVLLTEHPGFDTGDLAGLFRLEWLECIKHDRPILDAGVPGSYFTEIHADLSAVKEAA